MKFICDRAALLDALTATASVTPTRTSTPILQCVKLTVRKDGMVLAAYDHEVGLRFRVRQVEVSTPGETLVACDRLLAIIRESTDETMSFEKEEDLLHIRGSDSHYQIVGQNVREFPPVPDMEGEPDFTIKVGALKNGVDKTLFAAARESTRYAINGVLWQKRGKQLRLIATDGRRLAMSNATLEKADDKEVEAIVPTKALALFSRLHFDADEPVEVRITTNQVVLRTEKATISSVLVEGNFPKWEDVVPRDNDKEFTLDTGEFLSAVKRAALLANVESKGIAMRLLGKRMELSSRSAEQGEALVNMEVAYNGEDMRIGFNPEFLIEALKVCDDKMTFKLKDSSKPGLIRSGKDFEYVVMPVNLS